MRNLLFSLVGAAALGLAACVPATANASWLSQALHYLADRQAYPAPVYAYTGYGAYAPIPGYDYYYTYPGAGYTQEYVPSYGSVTPYYAVPFPSYGNYYYAPGHYGWYGPGRVWHEDHDHHGWTGYRGGEWHEHHEGHEGHEHHDHH